MNIRERLEKQEEAALSPKAQLSSKTHGRLMSDPDECSVRTVYQRDRDKILHSQSFRNLKFKTNVFISTTGEKFRTRLTHTLEVSSIARTICQALRLNQDLSEAIALGHDLGHTPFGHTGEDVLNELAPGGFHHSKQSLRVVDLIEKSGSGLNLTYEVRDGILKHSKGGRSMNGFIGSGEFGVPETLEGRVMQFADWIGYINHDTNDALNMGLIRIDDLPEESLKVLGERHSQRINKMVCDLVNTSTEFNRIMMSPIVMSATEKLRSFLYSDVYTKPEIAGEQHKARRIMSALYVHFSGNSQELKKEFPFREKIDGETVVDFLAGLSDSQAQEIYDGISS
jgi:dGTPase